MFVILATDQTEGHIGGATAHRRSVAPQTNFIQCSGGWFLTVLGALQRRGPHFHGCGDLPPAEVRSLMCPKV